MNQQTRTSGTATTGTVRPSDDASVPMSSRTDRSDVASSSRLALTSVVKPSRSVRNRPTSSRRTASVRSR
jgi:hypothetical protein